MRAYRLLITTLAAALVGPAVLMAAPQAASAQTTPGIAGLALANVGKKACSVNSLKGRAFESSCTGNGGKPEYWCADFARWVWSRSGVADTSALNALAGSFYTYGEQFGTLSAEPAVGDAAVFDYNGAGDAEHVAIVTAVNPDGSVTTVSGDWNGWGNTEAAFSSTSTVVLNGPSYLGSLGTAPPVMGMTLSAFVAPVGVRVVPVIGEASLAAGQSLTAGQVLTSPDGVYSLTMQTDGNLVESTGTRVLWSAGTSGAGNKAVIETDGDLVIFSPSGADLWSSRTPGNAGSISFGLRDDGTLIINGPGRALWRLRPRTGTLTNAQSLLSGQHLMSSDSLYSLDMQGDGNLVEYTGGRAIWWSGTTGAGNRAVMQADGNLVVVSSTGAALWSSRTGGHSGSFSLVLMNYASLVVNGPSGQLWSNRL